VRQTPYASFRASQLCRLAAWQLGSFIIMLVYCTNNCSLAAWQLGSLAAWQLGSFIIMLVYCTNNCSLAAWQLGSLAALSSCWFIELINKAGKLCWRNGGN
jgi:hypothetical protein